MVLTSFRFLGALLDAHHPADLCVLISLSETMDDQAIKEIVAEIRPLALGHAPGKIFQLSPRSLVIDFRLRDHGDLFISIEPAQPRIYLVKRRVRDLEKQSIPLTPFSQGLRKELANTTLQSIEKDPNDRIVWFHFSGQDELGQNQERSLVAQLTGRAANLFLTNRQGLIINQAREGKGPGQKIGEPYQPPPAAGGRPATEGDLIKTIRDGRDGSASAAADLYFTSLVVRQAFDSRAGAARADLRKKITRQTKLLKQLDLDLASHANAEAHKRLGDLLLANLSTARREGNRVVLMDYFADEAAPFEIEIDEHSTLPEEAERQFALYSRSKRAVRQITSRIAAVGPELEVLSARFEALEKIISARDEAALDQFTAKSSAPSGPAQGSKQKPEKKIPGARSYLSSDGFEILVGRTSRDNDYLTFKVAKPNDLWLHTGDYSGSHVVVRNATRKDVPHRTLIEAAQLAAHFSQARKDPKVDVHYTQRKFVTKPKGAVPGLVRLTRFKNITVEPREGVARLER